MATEREAFELPRVVDELGGPLAAAGSVALMARDRADVDGAMVFVHGFGESAVTGWPGFPEAFESESRLASYDAYFFGYHAATRQMGTLAASMAWFLELLAAGELHRRILIELGDGSVEPQRYAKIVVCAYSMGAVVAREGALLAAERLEGLGARPSLRLFAPAHAGARVLTDLLAVGGAFPALRKLITAAGALVPALEDLDRQKSAYLERLRSRTESLASEGHAWLAARCVFGASEGVVFVDQFDCDSRQVPDPAGRDHFSLATLTPDWQWPIEFITAPPPADDRIPRERPSASLPALRVLPRMQAIERVIFDSPRIGRLVENLAAGPAGESPAQRLFGGELGEPEGTPVATGRPRDPALRLEAMRALESYALLAVLLAWGHLEGEDASALARPLEHLTRILELPALEFYADVKHGLAESLGGQWGGAKGAELPRAIATERKVSERLGEALAEKVGAEWQGSASAIAVLMDVFERYVKSADADEFLRAYFDEHGLPRELVKLLGDAEDLAAVVVDVPGARDGVGERRLRLLRGCLELQALSALAGDPAREEAREWRAALRAVFEERIEIARAVESAVSSALEKASMHLRASG